MLNIRGRGHPRHEQSVATFEQPLKRETVIMRTSRMEHGVNERESRRFNLSFCWGNTNLQHRFARMRPAVGLLKPLSLIRYIHGASTASENLMYGPYTTAHSPQRECNEVQDEA